MSAKRDRERAEVVAAARERQLREGIESMGRVATLADAIAIGLATYELTQLPHLPLGGGYCSHRRAIAPATFIADALEESGWTHEARP